MNESATKQKSLSLSAIKVRRDIQKSQRIPLPLADLTGKGVIDGSNNRAKMNDQRS